jgi:hypothetical protein
MTPTINHHHKKIAPVHFQGWGTSSLSHQPQPPISPQQRHDIA